MKHRTALCITTGLLALGGCDQVKKIDQGADTDGPSSLVPAPVQQRLDQSCAIPGCHVPGVTEPDLSEASGGAWVQQSGAGGPFVTFGDVGNSYIVEKMFPNPSSGGQMPFPPGVLEPEDLAVIVGWVAGVEFPDGETATTDTNASDTDDPTMASDTDTDDTSSGPVLCSIEVVAPDITSPVVSGDEAGVIPSAIGGALERNCGCHYSGDVPTPYTGDAAMNTLADFGANYDGSNPDYVGRPVWELVQFRVEGGSMPYPPPLCETVEDGVGITAADLALLEAWYEQEVPDGASFTPPG